MVSVLFTQYERTLLNGPRIHRPPIHPLLAAKSLAFLRIVCHCTKGWCRACDVGEWDTFEVSKIATATASGGPADALQCYYAVCKAFPCFWGGPCSQLWALLLKPSGGTASHGVAGCCARSTVGGGCPKLWQRERILDGSFSSFWGVLPNEVV